MHHNYFGSHTAKALMVDLNNKGRNKIQNIFSQYPFFSISEDEGTINGNTMILHNAHTCSPDLEIETFYLRYFETINKEAKTLVEH